jgi:hypothetical protein
MFRDRLPINEEFNPIYSPGYLEFNWRVCPIRVPINGSLFKRRRAWSKTPGIEITATDKEIHGISIPLTSGIKSKDAGISSRRRSRDRHLKDEVSNEHLRR